jgi:hypothetical protein
MYQTMLLASLVVFSVTGCSRSVTDRPPFDRFVNRPLKLTRPSYLLEFPRRKVYYRYEISDIRVPSAAKIFVLQTGTTVHIDDVITDTSFGRSLTYAKGRVAHPDTGLDVKFEYCWVEQDQKYPAPWEQSHPQQ